MLPINWSLFDMIPETETITQIDVTISITQEKLGKGKELLVLLLVLNQNFGL